jgi:hypothetical protein
MRRMNWLKAIFLFVRGFFIPRAALAAENLALRQQLALYLREKPKPRLEDTR